MYRALARAQVQAPTAVEDYLEGRLFGDPKATGALLEFLATTAIGCPQGGAVRTVERARVDEEWGIEALDEEGQG